MELTVTSRRIIHPGGVESLLNRRWSMHELAELFGVQYLDVVFLADDVLMLVCDNQDQPINHAATALLNAKRMGIEKQIFGPVVIVPVSDFELVEAC